MFSVGTAKKALDTSEGGRSAITVRLFGGVTG